MTFDLTGENVYLYVECPGCKKSYGVNTTLKSEEVLKGMGNDFRDITDKEFQLTCPACTSLIKFNIKEELLKGKSDQPKKKGFFGKLFGK